MSNSKQVSSANRIIWEYCECLREIIRDIEDMNEAKHIRRKIILCVFMSIAVIETFLNIYFRILAEKSDCPSCGDQTLKELNENMSLDRKIRTWPKRFFHKEIDFGQGIGQRFMKLKSLRNRLMHFQSSYDTLEIPGMTIQGLADTTSYDVLSKDVALESLSVAEGLIEEVFRLKGMSSDEIKHSVHGWIGKIPSNNLST